MNGCAEAAPTLRLEDIDWCYAYNNEEIDSGSLRRVLLLRAQDPLASYTHGSEWASIPEGEFRDFHKKYTFSL